MRDEVLRSVIKGLKHHHLPLRYFGLLTLAAADADTYVCELLFVLIARPLTRFAPPTERAVSLLAVSWPPLQQLASEPTWHVS